MECAISNNKENEPPGSAMRAPACSVTSSQSTTPTANAAMRTIMKNRMRNAQLMERLKKNPDSWKKFLDHEKRQFEESDKSEARKTRLLQLYLSATRQIPLENKRMPSFIFIWVEYARLQRCGELAPRFTCPTLLTGAVRSVSR